MGSSAPGTSANDRVAHHAVQVPATSANLGAGFDAFGLALDRYLAARSVPAAADRPRVNPLDGAEVPTGEDNLVWRSFVAACDAAEVAVPDVKLEVRSAIPLERGLGSSSAAIVAGLTLARAVAGLRLSDRELIVLADRLEGHPDNVAPAVLGGLVACARTDDGELIVRRINPATDVRPVALIPTRRQSTTAARAVLPGSLDRADVATQVARGGHVLAALTGAWPVSAALTGDRLHEPARTAVMPEAGELLTRLRAAGVPAWLSGAGPTVAALVPASDGAAVDRLVGPVGDADVEVVPLEVELSGARDCPDGGCGLSGMTDCAYCPRLRL